MTTYDCCPPNLELVSHPTKGRFLTAKTTFQPGDIVLGPERPYARVHFKPETRCDCCNQPGANLKRCGACKIVYYLDAEHQRRGWQQGHKQECAALRQWASDPRVAEKDPIPASPTQLAARILWRQYNDGKSSGGGGVDLASLVHHWDSMGQWHKALYADVGTRIWYVSGVFGVLVCWCVGVLVVVLVCVCMRFLWVAVYTIMQHRILCVHITSFPHYQPHHPMLLTPHPPLYITHPPITHHPSPQCVGQLWHQGHPPLHTQAVCTNIRHDRMQLSHDNR